MRLFGRRKANGRKHGRKKRRPMLSAFLTIAYVLGFLSAIDAVMTGRTSQGSIAWAMALTTFPMVSVPAYWTRRLTGSFHVAERIGAVVATHLGLSHVPLLRRVRGGPSQIGLTYTQRLQNVKGAFRVRRGFNMVSARLLLVDDVRTTGATLAECARVLRRAGAKKVYAGAVVSADTLHAGMIASPRA